MNILYQEKKQLVVSNNHLQNKQIKYFTRASRKKNFMRYIYRARFFSGFNLQSLEKHALIMTSYGFAHFQTFEKKMQVVYKIGFFVYFK